jgi:hypothetical protein
MHTQRGRQILLLFIILGSSVLKLVAQTQISFDYSTFILKENNRGILTDSLLEKNSNRITGNFKGGKFILGDEYTSLSIGIGLSKIRFEKEIQGFFPNTNQFGAAIIKGESSYWAFPLAVSWSRRPWHFYRRKKLDTRIEFSYIPCIINNSGISSEAICSAKNNSFVINYPDNSKIFQHSVNFAINFRVPVEIVNLNVSPFAGIGSAYYKNSAGFFAFTYGVNVSLRVNFFTISINREPVENKKSEAKKKELEKKQKEIQEKLKQQPIK